MRVQLSRPTEELVPDPDKRRKSGHHRSESSSGASSSGASWHPSHGKLLGPDTGSCHGAAAGGGSLGATASGGAAGWARDVVKEHKKRRSFIHIPSSSAADFGGGASGAAPAGGGGAGGLDDIYLSSTKPVGGGRETSVARGGSCRGFNAVGAAGDGGNGGGNGNGYRSNENGCLACSPNLGVVGVCGSGNRSRSGSTGAAVQVDADVGVIEGMSGVPSVVAAAAAAAEAAEATASFAAMTNGKAGASSKPAANGDIEMDFVHPPPCLDRASGDCGVLGGEDQLGARGEARGDAAGDRVGGAERRREEEEEDDGGDMDHVDESKHERDPDDNKHTPATDINTPGTSSTPGSKRRLVTEVIGDDDVDVSKPQDMDEGEVGKNMRLIGPFVGLSVGRYFLVVVFCVVLSAWLALGACVVCVVCALLCVSRGGSNEDVFLA